MRLAAYLMLVAGGVCAQDISDAPEGATLPLAVEIPSPPTAVRSDGGYRLSYEAHLTNWSSHEMILTSIEVLPKRDSAEGFKLAGEGLEHSLINGDARSASKRRIAPGGRAVVLFFLSASGVPKEFYHRIRFHSAGKEEELLMGPVKVTAEELVIQPPLRGKGWRRSMGPVRIPITGAACFRSRADWSFPSAGRSII